MPRSNRLFDCSLLIAGKEQRNGPLLLGTQAERMKYPEYRAQNLPIGSGVVESACKHVVATRCKRAGMRWDQEGEEDILALRCGDLSGRWDEIWKIQAA